MIHGSKIPAFLPGLASLSKSLIVYPHLLLLLMVMIALSFCAVPLFSIVLTERKPCWVPHRRNVRMAIAT